MSDRTDDLDASRTHMAWAYEVEGLVLHGPWWFESTRAHHHRRTKTSTPRKGWRCSAHGSQIWLLWALVVVALSLLERVIDGVL
jgi:hypothetical protein